MTAPETGLESVDLVLEHDDAVAEGFAVRFGARAFSEFAYTPGTLFVFKNEKETPSKRDQTGGRVRKKPGWDYKKS
jgi:hypothetical protein